jgi:polyhydroxyalkanoate synthase subunit PhaC
MDNPTAHEEAERLAHALRTAQDRMSESLAPDNAAQLVLSGFADACRAWFEALARQPQTLMDLQGRYFQDQVRIWSQAFQPEVAGTAGQPSEPGDRRFAAPEWSQIPLFRYYRDAYLSTSKALMDAVEGAQLDDRTKQRVRFFVRQCVDATAPSNFLLTNPEALKEAVQTHGESLQAGLRNLLADLEKGHVSMTDEAAFEVGRNVGMSPGAVVFENDLIQLIQYQPLTKKVHERPIVFVPAAINKFYIMDLQPDNSLVRYAVEQGHTVFMVSWRNVKPPLDTLTWDDYMEMGIIAALEEAKRIAGADKVNALGFCVGGTLLACGVAILEARKRSPVASLTLMTTLLDFSDVGDVRVFIDEDFVQKREKQLLQGGIVPGAQLASSFSALRANDLVWSYVVNNYLKGKSPPAFDLLYWNSDSTNLPGPMYAYYLRNTYLLNKLAKPDALTNCGEKVSLKRIKVPAFVLSAREDHIVPWKGGYQSARCLGGPVTFVLGASGHIAGAINPASKNKRSYWTGPSTLPAKADDWFAQAREHPGSWWIPWAKWLAGHAGPMVPAREKLGSARRRPIEPAPGRYVKERAEID